MPYFDNSATTRQHDEVTEAMLGLMQAEYGNPSSLHRMGFSAQKLLEEAREKAAKSLGVGKDEIFFTCGGTFSDNLSLIGAARAMARRGNRIITVRTEHPAVLEPCRYLERSGFEVIYLDVNDKGQVDLDQLENSLSDKTILVSVMHVNNETGAVQPLEKIGEMIKRRSGAVFHSDAVQSFGKIRIPIRQAGLDIVSASSHKIHGPKGVGLIYVKKGVRIEPVSYGGGQEKDMNPGTENVPAIAGFGHAINLAFDRLDADEAHVRSLKQRLISLLEERPGDIRINADPEESSPYILNVSFIGTKAEVLLHMLEQDDIYVSTGSACSSKKKANSHVLTSMGLSQERVQSALRFSFSAYNTMDEIEYAALRIDDAVNDMRRVLRGKSR